MNINSLDKYILDLSKYIPKLKNKTMLIYVAQEAKRLDVNNQIYYIQGASSVDMVEIRKFIMSTKIPSITGSLDMINTSDYENVVNTFAISQIPIRVLPNVEDIKSGILSSKSWYNSKIGKITFELNITNNTDKDIHITTSSETMGYKHFYVNDDQGYNVEIQDDFYICSLGKYMKLSSYYTCSTYLPFCTMLVYSENIIIDDDMELHVYKITMKSIPYNLIEILDIKGILERI